MPNPSDRTPPPGASLAEYLYAVHARAATDAPDLPTPPTWMTLPASERACWEAVARVVPVLTADRTASLPPADVG